MQNMNSIKLLGLNYRKKYNVSKNKVYAALKGKGRPGGSQYCQKKKERIKVEATMSHSDTLND